MQEMVSNSLNGRGGCRGHLGMGGRFVWCIARRLSVLHFCYFTSLVLLIWVDWFGFKGVNYRNSIVEFGCPSFAASR